MNKSCGFHLFFLLFSMTNVMGQEDLTITNIQDYTPSILINKGQTEFKLYNNLYNQNSFFNEDGAYQDDGGRSTYFTSIAAYNYGVSSRVSLGGELWLKSTSIGDENSSPTNVLMFSNSSKSRTGITLVGMKVKFNPIKKWGKLSMQSGVFLSVISDPQSENLDRPFLDNNRHLWITKFLYDRKISEKFQVFTQLSAWMSIDKNLADENTSLAIPIDVFISYFPTKKITVFMQNQLWPSIGDKGLSSYFLQEGLGIKYQLFNGLELETSYTSFVMGENAGAGQTVNLGVRILH